MLISKREITCILLELCEFSDYALIWECDVCVCMFFFPLIGLYNFTVT